VPDVPLQSGSGPIDGEHYLPSTPDAVRWGYVPAIGAAPVLRVPSGATVTIDAVSHEGILEDQGRDPVTWFGRRGVPESGVLTDAVAVARDYARHTRSFDVDGPHVITGPVYVEGAAPGDVLKIETLSALPRVPYGVVSSRHGKGALARAADGNAPAGITLDEVMPPVATDGRATGDPTRYGNTSVFTRVRAAADGTAVGYMTFGDREVVFPLRPFMGTMGVAHTEAPSETAPELNSIPPTLGGGNIDIRLLGPGSAFYLPVRAEGALFYVGDPHLAMGDGEVALTAVEGALRATFRLTVCKAGSGDAPSVAYGYPFAETADAWVPIGLSDPDGAAGGGQGSDLDVAMRRAVVNALNFLERDRGMDRATAYAYLAATADFTVSQVVDRTVGVHGVIAKGHFAG
jgi:acetamidase/formamidase